MLVDYDGSDAKTRLRDGEGGAMLQDNPNESTGPKADGRRLSGGANRMFDDFRGRDAASAPTDP